MSISLLIGYREMLPKHIPPRVQGRKYNDITLNPLSLRGKRATDLVYNTVGSIQNCKLTLLRKREVSKDFFTKTK